MNSLVSIFHKLAISSQVVKWPKFEEVKKSPKIYSSDKCVKCDESLNIPNACGGGWGCLYDERHEN